MTTQTQPKEVAIILPQEVEQIAKSVSAEKRNEVQSVLNHVFNGVAKMRDQLDAIVVQDENDKVNMKLANTIRLGVRQVRLEAEKTFDAKRSEVQAQMLHFKTEDQLWLKSKQTMQILTKEIEENARWKEETRERFEAEQKELKIQQRIVQVSKFTDVVMRSEFENMSDQGFTTYLSGIEKQYNDKIEAEKKAEAERIAKEKADEEERERMRIENEKLKAEREAREKELEKERARVAKEKAIADAKLKEEREVRERLESEIKAKQEAEAKAKKDVELKAAAELKAKQDEEKKLAKAGDKEKLRKWLTGFSKSTIEIQTKGEAGDVKEEIEKKFDSFIVWANSQINLL